MGHFAQGRLLRYFIQPLLRDMLYIARQLPYEAHDTWLFVGKDARDCSS